MEGGRRCIGEKWVAREMQEVRKGSVDVCFHERGVEVVR